MSGDKRTRMPAGERRESVLAAASRAFARDGYYGTTTDAIARRARVSQPYVVRMFGTKSALFAEVFDRAVDRILEVVAPYLDDIARDPDDRAGWIAMGTAYRDLASDGDVPLVLLHGLVAGSSPEIGTQARAGLSRVYTAIRDRTGCRPEQARAFLANGMLLNLLVAMQVPAHRDEDAPLDELLAHALLENVAL